MAAGVIAALMMATILFTKSRAGLLGLAAALVVLVIEGRRLRPGLGVAAIVALLAGGALHAVLVLGPDWQHHRPRAGRVRIAAGAQGPDVGRLADLRRHPLTGVGAGQFKNYNPPDRLEPWRETHNVLLQIAAELGVFGLLAFLLLLWQAVSALLVDAAHVQHRQAGGAAADRGGRDDTGDRGVPPR